MNFPADRLRLALADRYRIEHELGAGGMATVYLAEDLKHDRKVAIKVLKPELAAVLGAERFVQEIKTTAALSHPHILPLFDSGEAGGFLYYVMPYIQGETIREKLNRETQFGIDEAVKIATEVADALDYAHRHGVIHRDIKPENILLHDGRPMVMDFGIALAVSAAAGGRMTETGLSLGTPHYMSPEQATADKQITARSDVYSLASVLYEMLTGHPPHVGSSAQQIIMRIIADVPRPATELRKSVPPHVTAALSRALEKLPADRFDSARAFADALGDRGFRLAEGEEAAAGAGAGDGTGTGSAGWRARAAVPLAALSIVLAAALAFMSFRSSSSEGLDRPTFASLDVSGMGVLGLGSDYYAVSPDGRSVAFVVEDGLAIRSLDSTGVVPLGRTFNATLPFWSPDGRAIGFFARDSLRVIELASGALRALCAVPRGSEGGTWSPNGTILFASGDSLVTTDARGERCTGERAGALGAGNLLRPYFLSDGRHYVATGDMKVWLGVLGSDSLVLLQEIFRHKAVVAAPDYLLWNTSDRLVAQRIDIAQGRLVGEPIAILPRMPNPGSETAVSASANGVLLGFESTRLTADTGRSANYLLANRGTGQVRAVRGGRWSWQGVRWSHDGRRIAMGGWQVQAMDVATRQWVRVGGSSEGPEATAYDPLWAPRDTAALFRFGGSSNAGSDPGLYSASTASGINRRIVAWPPPPLAGCCTGALNDLSPDGRRVAFAFGASRFLLNEAWEYDLQVDSARRLFDAEGRIDNLRYAPSGGWIAYQVTTGARTDVFVRPYPGPGTPVRLTNGDGRVPRWRADGSELFYVDASGNIVSVAVRTGSALSIGPPQVVLSADALPGRRVEEFDVSPDGHVLALDTRTYETSFLLVFNWHGLLDAGSK